MSGPRERHLSGSKAPKGKHGLSRQTSRESTHSHSAKSDSNSQSQTSKRSSSSDNSQSQPVTQKVDTVSKEAVSSSKAWIQYREGQDLSVKKSANCWKIPFGIFGDPCKMLNSERIESRTSYRRLDPYIIVLPLYATKIKDCASLMKKSYYIWLWYAVDRFCVLLMTKRLLKDVRICFFRTLDFILDGNTFWPWPISRLVSTRPDPDIFIKRNSET